MPDPREMSGIPRPTGDVEPGTVSVRVIRGNFDQNLAGETVEFTVGDRTVSRTTGPDGRAALSGLSAGDVVNIVSTVDGERLEAQPITMGAAGVVVMLVATDPNLVAREGENAALAAGPAIEGFVVLGPQSRVVVGLRDDELTIWYVLQILNTARSPVDIGGPLLIDLPREARGAAVVEGPPNQATANGPRVIVTGPFAPGETTVQVAFGLPHDGPSMRFVQVWPATLQQVTVLAEQSGSLSLSSPQFTEVEPINDQGQPLLLGSGPPIPAGGSLELEIGGLPFHPRWPRYLALTLAGAIILAGIWGAATARPRRIAA